VYNINLKFRIQTTKNVVLLLLLLRPDCQLHQYSGLARVMRNGLIVNILYTINIIGIYRAFSTIYQNVFLPIRN